MINGGEKTEPEERTAPCVINPFALAEAVRGRRIAWSRMVDPRREVERALSMSWRELLDPARSPLFLARQRPKPEETSTLERTHSLFRKLELDRKLEPLPMPLLDLAERLRAPAAARRLLGVLLPMFEEPVPGDWTGDGMDWEDRGDFFEEGTEFSDALQGATGDCYLIAALASIAWARPYVIVQRNRATGVQQDEFVNRIDFFSGGAAPVEVTERLPVYENSQALVYARSAESGEIWPGVYEKAYAKWKSGTTGDMPNIPAVIGNGGNPASAAAEVTALSPYWVPTSSRSGDELFQIVRSHCVGRRTFDPMMASTYGTSKVASPPSTDEYNDVGLVQWHAYSVLGWDYVEGTEYVVLRNPWGFQEATEHIRTGTWFAYNTSFWQAIALSSGGVFALKADTFQKYFAELSFVS